jgi:hypothetical protein
MTKKRGEGGLTPIGELVGGSRVVKQATALTPSVMRLLDAAQEIRTEPDAAEAAFMARQLVQMHLAALQPGKRAGVDQKNGNLTLGIQPGYDLKTGKAIG